MILRIFNLPIKKYLCPVIIFAENPTEIKKKNQNFIFAGNPIKIIPPQKSKVGPKNKAHFQKKTKRH